MSKFSKYLLISTFSLTALLATTNVASAKGRIMKSRPGRPRITRLTRARKIRPCRNSGGARNVLPAHSWRQFKVVNNSTRINHRMPKMRHVMSFPNVYHGGRWPQSLNVDKAGHYAYLGFDSFTSDGSKLIKYNLLRHHPSKTGRTFKGGHAQAVGTDSKGNLWFINRSSNNEADDHAGPIKKGSFVEVSSKSLKPVYRKFFKFGSNYMGDNLAFAGKFGVFNVSRIWGRNNVGAHYHRHMLVIYHTNQLSRKGSQWTPLMALKHTPGFFMIQAAGYNPRNQRLYVASAKPNVIVSMPVTKVLKRTLKRRDVQNLPVKLRAGQTIEGLAFDQKGYMYMLLGRPGRLLKSRRPVTK